jgi:hypothetical protein
MELPDPYSPYDNILSKLADEKNEVNYYACKSTNDARDFKSKAENKGWKCFFTSNILQYLNFIYN